MTKGIYKRTLKARKNMSKSKLGEKNPNFGNKKLKNPKSRNIKIEERAFERDKYTCQMCRKKFNSYDLILYYLTTKGKPTNKINNIITLCKECKIIVVQGSIIGKTKKGKNIISRWDKEDIKNMKICRSQTKTVYPIDKSQEKDWCKYVCDSQKKVNRTTPGTEEVNLEKIVNFTWEKLKEKMFRILKERGQNLEDWNFENWFRTFGVNCGQRRSHLVGSVEVLNRLSFLNQSRIVEEKEKLITMASK